MPAPRYRTVAARGRVHRSPRAAAGHAPKRTAGVERVTCGRCQAHEPVRADGSPRSHAIGGGSVTRNRIRCLGSTPTGG